MNILGIPLINIVSWLIIGVVINYFVNVNDDEEVSGGIIVTMIFGSIGAVASGYLISILLAKSFFQLNLEGLIMAGIGAFVVASFYRMAFKHEKYIKTTSTRRAI